MHASRKVFFPILAVLFLGYLGFSLALPLFPPLFMDPSRGFLPASTPYALRSILLGILFSMYPLGQFIGAPILGKISDKYGRRPTLLVSLLAIIPAYIGCALSIAYTYPLLLFLGRFLVGLFEGNVVIAQAAVADISENQAAKTKNFGWLISFSSIAFFFGPLLGSFLADAKLVSWFRYDTPFWVATFLVLLGFFVVLLFFKETGQKNKTQVIKIKTVFLSFFEGLSLPGLGQLFFAHLLVFSSMFFFFNFFSASLVSRFDFTIIQLGQTNAYLSLFLIFSPMIFKQFARYIPPHQTLIVGAFGIGLSLLFFTLPWPPWSLLLILPFLGVSLAIGFAFPAILVSELVKKNIQGQALGTNLSIQVCSEALTALIGGMLFAMRSHLPFLVGVVCSWAGAVFLLRLFYKKKASGLSIERSE